MDNDALNAAGEALKALGLGAVRLRYRPADELIRYDRYTLWVEPEAGPDIVGEGDTPADALAHALDQMK